MRKNWMGNVAIIVLALVNVALWVAFTPADDGTREGYGRRLFSEILSSTAMVLMASALFLSTRPRYLESFFGGLDKMYHAHKNAAMAALLLVVAHFLIMPLGGDDDDELEEAAESLSPFVEFLADIFGASPVLESLGEVLGLVAFAGLLALVLLTVAPRLPLIGSFTRFSYSRWLKTHKFIGIFFIIGFFHSLTVDALVLAEPVLLAYLTAASIVGAVCYLYTEILAVFFRKRFSFVVEAVRRLNGTTTELALKPLAEKPRFTAGQFAFVSFPGDKAMEEPHPFTVCSSPNEENMRFAIKASGDWTRQLNAHLQCGDRARVDGCYGRFNYKTGGREQIWIAGGIGITPFMSWIRDFEDGPDADVEMYYTVRGEGDLLFSDEIASADSRYDHFRHHIKVSSQDGNLTVEEIASRCEGEIRDRHVYMCGPIAMMDSMERQFKKMGVPAENIHYEEFNFR